ARRRSAPPLHDPVPFGGLSRARPRLTSAPVALARPVARERLNRRELHDLGLVADDLPLRPPRSRGAALHVGQRFVREVHVERPNGVGAHLALRLRSRRLRQLVLLITFFPFGAIDPCAERWIKARET